MNGNSSKIANASGAGSVNKKSLDNLQCASDKEDVDGVRCASDNGDADSLRRVDDSNLRLIAVSDPEARPLLKDISHVYTDLDGTLFAPGGKLLAGHDGQPSTQTAEALAALQRAGIEVVIVTGRDGNQGRELLRILNLESYIGELGCLRLDGTGANTHFEYELGEWESTVLDTSYQPPLAPGELPAGLSPYRLMLASGTVERLLAAFPGKLENHLPYPNERHVTQALRGFIDLEKARQILACEHLPLELIDNGQIHPQQHTLVNCPEIHIYHLVPRGTSKARAVAADIARRGLRREQTLAIGDSISDLEMGEATGSLVMMGNSLHTPIVQNGLQQRAGAGMATLHTEGFTADGWAEFARALLYVQ